MDNNTTALEFMVQKRHYNIPFLYYPIVQLKGDSAAGKSLFVQDFETLKRTNKDYANSPIINVGNRESLKLLKDKSFDYVIIDNADLLITHEIDKFIFSHIITMPETHYIILGRKNFACVGHPLGLGTFIRTKDNTTGDYYFTVDFTHTA